VKRSAQSTSVDFVWRAVDFNPSASYLGCMPIYRLSKEIAFPDPRDADEQGILAVGGDLNPQRILLAYALGIFPWYSRGEPIIWWSPDPRMVLLPAELHVGRSLQKEIKRGAFELRMDTAFEEVLTRCAQIKRPGQRGTWITPDMFKAYSLLHQLGFAHSIEAYQNNILVGGLYGVSLGSAFFGESMFAEAPDASKIAFVSAVREMTSWGFDLIDCQVYTEHLARFGAKEIPREEFLTRLEKSLQTPTRKGKWAFQPSPAPTLS
jgi:leucyl/phenylalanyl-tRNA--protein transferase